MYYRDRWVWRGIWNALEPRDLHSPNPSMSVWRCQICSRIAWRVESSAPEYNSYIASARARTLVGSNVNALEHQGRGFGLCGWQDERWGMMHMSKHVSQLSVPHVVRIGSASTCTTMHTASLYSCRSNVLTPIFLSWAQTSGREGG